MVEAYRPSTLVEALEIRARLGAVPFAGGTDLMVKLRRGAGEIPGFDRPVLLLDLLRELSAIEPASGALEIGCLVPLAALAESSLVPRTLREIARQIGGPALRNVATIGGNICNASPAGDTLPFLYAFDAEVRLLSSGSQRTLPIGRFITGPGSTLLGPREILGSVLIPPWSPAVLLWRKVGTRKANALTKVSIAAFADVAGDAIGRVRISLGAVSPTVIRLTEAEELLEGARRRDLRGEKLAAALRQIVGRAVHPIDDQRSTSAYRLRVAQNLVESFLGLLASEAEDGRREG